MDITLVNKELWKLKESISPLHYSAPAPLQAVRQFNALLTEAKAGLPDQAGVQALAPYPDVHSIASNVLLDSVDRLIVGVELRLPTPNGQFLAQIKLPGDCSTDAELDLNELNKSVTTGAHKAALLIAGSLAEALLLMRHPDKSDRGPGLGALVKEAERKQLLAPDTLRLVQNLVTYRDLIHPRAERRTKAERGSERVQSALIALCLLCHDLADGRRFGP